MSEQLQQLQKFIKENQTDLITLGVVFLQMLDTDFNVNSVYPSKTVWLMLNLEERKILSTNKSFVELMKEINSLGMEPITDECGGSVFSPEENQCVHS